MNSHSPHPPAKGPYVERRTFQTWGWLVMIQLVAVAALYFQSRRTGVILDFFPTNGDLQTWNPIRRMLDGQSPGRDFDLYLGWGLTWLLQITSWLFGGNYAATRMAAHFLCGLSFYGTLLVSLRLGGLRWAIGSLLALLATTLCLTPSFLMWVGSFERHPMMFFYALSLNAEPGPSIRVVRAVISVLAVVWFFFLHQAASRAQARPAARTGIWILGGGIAAGFAFSWSSDYGPITCLAMLAYVATRIFLDGTGPLHRRFLQACAAGLVSAALAAMALFGFLCLLARDMAAPFRWLSYWRTISRDSFWYFDMPFQKILTLGDLKFNASVPLAILCAGVLLWRFHRKRRFTDLLGAGFLGIHAATASALCIFNSQLVQYFHMLYICALAIFAGLFLSRLLPSWMEDSEEKSRSASLRTPAIVLAITIVLLTYSVWQDGMFSRNVRSRVVDAAEWNPAQIPNSTEMGRRMDANTLPLVEVPELGGFLPLTYAGELKAAREDALTLPPGNSIYSTYAGFAETFAGKWSLTRQDYLIHTISEANLRHTVEIVEEAKPERIITIPPSYSSFEPWLRTQNWMLYRFILQNYEPLSSTTFYLRWRKRSTPESIPVKWQPCEIRWIGPSAVDLHCPPSAEELPGSGPLLGEVEVTYRGLKTGASRIYVHTLKDLVRGDAGVPPEAKGRLIPVSGDTRAGGFVPLRSSPAKTTKLEVESARYRWLGRTSDLKIPEPVTTR